MYIITNVMCCILQIEFSFGFGPGSGAVFYSMLWNLILASQFFKLSSQILWCTIYPNHIGFEFFILTISILKFRYAEYKMKLC